MTWYAVFYGKTYPDQFMKWYASTMDKKTAEEWVQDLKAKGLFTRMETHIAPYEYEGKCQ